ncbi:hypothetical protein ABVK25_008685 [Lepraria finkii]|uniref:Uncharacterized protein n=1 Tax=Lepraria finkii TaxID=1340010 RepID=A0ABR4B2G4_9LECA
MADPTSDGPKKPPRQRRGLQPSNSSPANLSAKTRRPRKIGYLRQTQHESRRKQRGMQREHKSQRLPREKDFKDQRAAVEASKAEAEASKKGSKEQGERMDIGAEGIAKAAEEEGANEDGEKIDTELRDLIRNPFR